MPLPPGRITHSLSLEIATAQIVTRDAFNATHFYLFANSRAAFIIPSASLAFYLNAIIVRFDIDSTKKQLKRIAVV